MGVTETKQSSGFDLEKIAPSVSGKPGTVRIVYEGHIDWVKQTADLRAELNSPEEPEWEIGTLKQVLSVTGATQRMKEIEQQMKERGYGENTDGYIVNISGPMFEVKNKMLEDALGSVVVDGSVITIAGRLSGR